MVKNLDVDTIKSILLNKFIFDDKRNTAMSQRIFATMGFPVAVQTQADFDLKEGLLQKMSSLIALRLVEDDRSIPILSAEDFDQQISEYIGNKISEDTTMDQPDREVLEPTIKPVILKLIEGLMGFMKDETDPYEEYWRLINTIKALANDEMLSLSILFDDAFYDEVTRRVTTRDQYIVQSEKALGFVTDPQKLIDTFITPILQALVADESVNSEELGELTEELKSQLAPAFQKFEQVTKEILAEEVDRLYSK